MPAMATFLNVEMGRLACAMAKPSSATSQAISQELGQVREAVLENHTAIDYLFLRRNHGCEELEGLCCFNLTDNSQLTEHKVKQVKEVVFKIKQREEFFGIDLSELTSWLPGVPGLERPLLFSFFSSLSV
ncbi:hypothetical protein HJG60_010590 [Phyllostomus discolor]|uniref:Uncharacterized protein n=1 Tax=Phyllostomus discolor TaxID=89673 RepID=A0A834APM1_9CHIR|nr:hypothetical protein HJG60_010590 [Phyllostomus discolor]